MKRTFFKIVSVLLSVILAFSVASVAFAAEKTDYCPTIIIPGLFQSDVRLYNDDGTEAVNSDGGTYSKPFYLDSTKNIVKQALKGVGLPLLKTLITQSDDDGSFASAFAETAGNIVFDKVSSTSQGQTKYNVKAVKYSTSLEKCSEEDKEKILGAIPIQEYVNIAGADHLYFLSYNSFGNLNDITQDLYDLIQQAKSDLGCDKVNIVPISQGGSICNNLLEYYPQVVSDLNRIIYVVPALDGANVLGDIYEYGLNDDDDAVYGYMWQGILKDETTGDLVKLLIRLFPKTVFNNVLDKTADKVIDMFKYSTAIWALIPSEYYEDCANRYLSGEDDAYIRSQTDSYYKAQLNSDKNILAARDAGVEIFDVVNYNHAMYPIADTWDDVNADGIIQLDSTSMGATSAGIDKELPDGYVQQGNSYGTCSDPEHHNHIDSHNMVDASTGLLPDNTFYYYNGNHEETSQDDAAIKLVERLLTDESFTDVYSYPDEFPQFNTARVSKGLINDVNKMRTYDVSSLSAEDASELNAAIAQCDKTIANTNVDIDEFNAASDRFYAIYDKINGTSHTEDTTLSFKDKLIRKLSAFVDKTIGARGYSDVFKGIQ